MGFDRARNDVGCTANDGVHCLDLFIWLLGAAPKEGCAGAMHRRAPAAAILIATVSSGAARRVITPERNGMRAGTLRIPERVPTLESRSA